ncbi:amine oxidase, partial [Metarhizium majus ARSEF 297]
MEYDIRVDFSCIKNDWAYHLVELSVMDQWNKMVDDWYRRHLAESRGYIPLITGDKLPEFDPEWEKKFSKLSKCRLSVEHLRDFEVCVSIIGTGAAGPFTALILDYLNSRSNEKFSYDILESSNRPGGRLYSHHFRGPPHDAYDYYDVDAMRFPERPIMKR